MLKLEFQTFIVSIFNSEKYLCDCLNSLVNQTYKNIEIILINDGSTDSSLKIARNYALKDKRILLATKLNGGASSARNLALELSLNTPLRKFIKDSKTSNIKNINLESKIKKINDNEFFFDLDSIYDYLTPSKLDNDIFFHFVDSDDYVSLDLAQCIYKKKKNNNNKLDLIIYNFAKKDELNKDSKKEDSKGVSKNELLEKYKNFNDNRIYSGFELLNLQHSVFSSATFCAFKGSTLNKYHLRFIEKVEFEDNAFGIVLYALSNRVGILSSIHYYYRIRSNSIMNYSNNSKNIPLYATNIRKEYWFYRNYKKVRDTYCIAMNVYFIIIFFNSLNNFEHKEILKRYIVQFTIKVRLIFATKYRHDPKIKMCKKFLPPKYNFLIKYPNIFRILFFIKQFIKSL